MREQLLLQAGTHDGDRHRHQVHHRREHGHGEHRQVLGQQQGHPRDGRGDERLERPPLPFPSRQVDRRIDGSGDRHQDEDERDERGKRERRGAPRGHRLAGDGGRHAGPQLGLRQAVPQRGLVEDLQAVVNKSHRAPAGRRVGPIDQFAFQRRVRARRVLLFRAIPDTHRHMDDMVGHLRFERAGDQVELDRFAGGQEVFRARLDRGCTGGGLRFLRCQQLAAPTQQPLQYLAVPRRTDTNDIHRLPRLLGSDQHRLVERDADQRVHQQRHQHERNDGATVAQRLTQLLAGQPDDAPHTCTPNQWPDSVAHGDPIPASAAVSISCRNISVSDWQPVRTRSSARVPSCSRRP